MNDEKSWYLSKSVIGSVVAILALIAGAFGYDVDAAGQEQITLSVIGIIGAGLAIYGRIKAVKKLTK
jgi:hypothetical protein